MVDNSSAGGPPSGQLKDGVVAGLAEGPAKEVSPKKVRAFAGLRFSCGKLQCGAGLDSPRREANAKSG